jgi:hypothetical protein
MSRGCSEELYWASFESMLKMPNFGGRYGQGLAGIGVRGFRVWVDRYDSAGFERIAVSGAGAIGKGAGDGSFLGEGRPR